MEVLTAVLAPIQACIDLHRDEKSYVEKCDKCLHVSTVAFSSKINTRQ